MARRVTHVVLDEADLLLGGGYERDSNRLLQLLRGFDRQVAEVQLARELRLPLHGYLALPRLVRKAGLEGDPSPVNSHLKAILQSLKLV